jgi:hypothetical protein
MTIKPIPRTTIVDHWALVGCMMINKSLDLLQCRSAALKSYVALALALISLSWEMRQRER